MKLKLSSADRRLILFVQRVIGMKFLWLRRVIASLLILLGAGGLVVVFWWYPYTLRYFDDDWHEEHSTAAYWNYTQEYIRLFGWRHDDSGIVGNFGGKEWAEWVFGHLIQDGNPEGCEAGHRIFALEKITNYAPGEHGHWKQSYPKWMAWWEANRDKTQEEWIVAGFAAAGATIHNPPAKEDWPALLTVISESEEKGKPRASGYRPSKEYLRYNACRCLRDTGFNSMAFALEGNHSPEVKAGLLSYHRFEGWGDDRPGRLFKAKNAAPFNYIPAALTTPFRIGWGSAAVAAIVIGIWLFRRSWKPVRLRTVPEFG